MIKSYEELKTLDTFEERFRYLKLDGVVGDPYFGFMRMLNQDFYRSAEWKRARSAAIARDLGCDLGIEGREIFSNIIVHHINPISIEDLKNGAESLIDLNNLICVCKRTHDAIHYSDESILNLDFVERKPNDTIPWR